MRQPFRYLVQLLLRPSPFLWRSKTCPQLGYTPFELFTDVIPYIVLVLQQALCDFSRTGIVPKLRHWCLHRTCFPLSPLQVTRETAFVTQITGECPQLGTPTLPRQTDSSLSYHSLSLPMFLFLRFDCER